MASVRKRTWRSGGQDKTAWQCDLEAPDELLIDPNQRPTLDDVEALPGARPMTEQQVIHLARMHRLRLIKSAHSGKYMLSEWKTHYVEESFFVDGKQGPTLDQIAEYLATDTDDAVKARVMGRDYTPEIDDYDGSW